MIFIKTSITFHENDKIFNARSIVNNISKLQKCNIHTYAECTIYFATRRTPNAAKHVRQCTTGSSALVCCWYLKQRLAAL